MSTLQTDPSALNEFFNKTAERLVGQNATTDDVILSHTITDDVILSRLQVAITVSNFKK